MANVPALPGHALLLLLMQLAVLLAVSRLLGELFKRIDQPAVIGELLAGIVLGPSLLGRFWPGGFQLLFPAEAQQVHLLETVAWLGMIMLLLFTGFETDVRLLRRLGRAALMSSLFGMAVPFVSGFAFGEWLPERYLADPGHRHLFAAFFATAMSISAMPVIAKILMDLELTKRNIGVVILSAGVVDDTMGWLILSVIASLAGSSGFSLLGLMQTLLFTAAFLGALIFGAYPAARWLFRVVDDRARGRNTDLSLVMVFTFLAAAATEWIGIHAVFGAFVMGCALRQVPRIRAATMQRLEAVVVSIFAPIFFGMVGLKVDLHALADRRILWWVLGVATAGKLVGCTIGGLAGRLSFWESLSIGMGMNARGAMELVVALLGLNLGILNPQMYSVIVAIAVITSFMAPLLLRLTTRFVKMSEAERARLAADQLKGLFDPHTLRALVPTAGGPNALAAGRLATALARGEGATITAIYVNQKGWSPWRWLVQKVRGPDLAGRNLQEHLDSLRAVAERRAVRLDVRRFDSRDAAEVICREAARGTELVLLGAGTRPRQALRGELIANVLEEAPCHVALLRSRLVSADFSHLLVPFDGSYFSQAALELALLYSESTGGEVTVLYVAEDMGDESGASQLEEGFRKMIATTMMASFAPILTQTKVKVSVVVRESPQLTSPVLREASSGRYDLMVVGAERHAVQHRISVGYDIERLVDQAECSVLVMVPKIESGAGKDA